MVSSWFGGHAADNREERHELYWAQAKGWSEAHKFPKQGARREQTCKAIQFICESDVIDDPAHEGFFDAAARLVGPERRLFFKIAFKIV